MLWWRGWLWWLLLLVGFACVLVIAGLLGHGRGSFEAGLGNVLPSALQASFLLLVLLLALDIMVADIADHL